MMSSTGDEFEVRMHPEKPGILEYIDLSTMNSIEFTIDEAFTMLKLMLEHRTELNQLRRGTDI